MLHNTFSKYSFFCFHLKVYATVYAGTQEIEGKTHWEISVIGGFLSRAGTVSFTVQYFRAQVNLSQPLDTRKRPSMEELELELGNIQTRIHGAGTIDYLVEASINILPNLLRFDLNVFLLLQSIILHIDS